MIKISQMTREDYQGILDVADALPEWFDIDARKRAIPIDLCFQDGYVAKEEGTIVGFITLFVSEGRVNIGWMGVDPAYHRRGIGGDLISAAESFCKDNGIQELATYTLGDSVDYEPYQATRAFYSKHGFQIYQRSQTDNPGCPEEIKIKKFIHQ